MDSLETMLADLFEARWPESRNPYELNKALELKPWTSPATSIWYYHTKGIPDPHPAVGDETALRVLKTLFADYQEATK